METPKQLHGIREKLSLGYLPRDKEEESVESSGPAGRISMRAQPADHTSVKAYWKHI